MDKLPQIEASTSSTQTLPSPVVFEPAVLKQTTSDPDTSELTAPEQTNFIQVSETELATQQLTTLETEQTQPPSPNQIRTLSVPDKPSTSSDLEILEQPPLDILESDYVDTELLKLSSDMHTLMQLRRVPTLSLDYELHSYL